MRIEIQHPSFKSQHLSVETACSLFRGSKLLLNGAVVKRRQRRYPVTMDSGAETLIQMKFNLIDSVPTLKIEEETIRLVESLRWYEYAWGGLPILLVYAGVPWGGLGGWRGHHRERANI